LEAKPSVAICSASERAPREAPTWGELDTSLARMISSPVMLSTQGAVSNLQSSSMIIINKPSGNMMIQRKREIGISILQDRWPKRNRALRILVATSD